MLTLDGVVHSLQPLFCDSAIVPQHPPVVIVIAAVQEGQVGLTDGDIFWCCVLVQLLMPLLKKGLVVSLQDMK